MPDAFAQISDRRGRAHVCLVMEPEVICDREYEVIKPRTGARNAALAACQYRDTRLEGYSCKPHNIPERTVLDCVPEVRRRSSPLEQLQMSVQKKDAISF